MLRYTYIACLVHYYVLCTWFSGFLIDGFKVFDGISVCFVYWTSGKVQVIYMFLLTDGGNRAGSRNVVQEVRAISFRTGSCRYYLFHYGPSARLTVASIFRSAVSCLCPAEPAFQLESPRYPPVCFLLTGYSSFGTRRPLKQSFTAVWPDLEGICEHKFWFFFVVLQQRGTNVAAVRIMFIYSFQIRLQVPCDRSRMLHTSLIVCLSATGMTLGIFFYIFLTIGDPNILNFESKFRQFETLFPVRGLCYNHGVITKCLLKHFRSCFVEVKMETAVSLG
jgi:hypothetical protein